MMNTLALVAPEIKTTKRLVSPSKAARLLADFKKKNSWCVDVSGNFPILMHGLSDQTATVQDIRFEFTSWAAVEGIRVDCANYATFLASLPDRVMSLMPRVYGKGMRPCSDRFIKNDSGLLLVNIYNPAAISAPMPIPAPFDKLVNLFGQQVPEVLALLFERVFPNVDERRYIIQRLAVIIQTPMRRAKHGVFLVGAGGTGKSTVLDILEIALRRRHVDRSQTYNGANNVHSEAYCNNHVFAFEDKAIGSGGESYVYTNLKQIIDYDRHTVNIKHGQRSVQRELHCNMFITTNNRDLFPWDKNERRFFAPQEIAHLHSEEESGQFLSSFHTFLQLPEAAAFLYDWLANVDIEGFDYGRCPRTPFMQSLIDQSGTMLDKNLDDFLDDRDIFHPSELNQYLSGRKQAYKTDELKKGLGIRGYEYVRPKFKCEGHSEARFSVWRKKPAVGRHFRDLTSAEKSELMMLESASC